MSFKSHFESHLTGYYGMVEGGRSREILILQQPANRDSGRNDRVFL